MRRPGMRRSSDGKFVPPCPACMLRYKRQRDLRDVLGLGTLVALVVALILAAVHFGWL